MANDTQTSDGSLALAPGARIGVLTSGGDAPGMNAAVRAIVKMAASKGYVAVGVEQGYRGLIDGLHTTLANADVDHIHRFGGTVLGSARALDFMEAQGQAKAQETVKRLGLDALLVIGGNGSLAGAKVAAGFQTASGAPLRVVGLPASIDNDIGMSSLSIGVDTAMNTIVEACDKISDTARAHNRAFIVEVMGRDCGYLAMASAVATGADAVLFRESGRGEEEIVAHVARVVKAAFQRDPPKHRVLILKAEGVQASSERIKARVDETLAAEGLSIETRVTVLGHVVRGGAPSAFDRLMAGRLGRAALWAAIEGHNGIMIGWQRSGLSGRGEISRHDPYCTLVSIDDVLEETARILDGTSPVARWRVKALEEAEELFLL